MDLRVGHEVTLLTVLLSWLGNMVRGLGKISGRENTNHVHNTLSLFFLVYSFI